MRRLLPVLLGATLVVAGCGDDSDGDRERAAATSIPDDTTSTTTSTATSTTTEPPVPPPDVIPTDVSLITEEYVEQVLDALYTVSLDAIVLAKEAGLVDEPSIRLIEAINSEATSLEAVNSLLSLAHDGFAGIQEDPAPARAHVLKVIARSQTCVFAEVDFDTSGLLTTTSDAPVGARTFATLVPATEQQVGSGLNPTAWALDLLPATEDGSVPDHRCAT